MSADITSPRNERIKWLVRLRDRSQRDDQGVFLVEGERLYNRALQAGLRPHLTFVTAGGQIETSGDTLTVDPAAMDRASYRQRSQGVIGVFPQISTSLSRVKLPDIPLILVAEGIEKPGNLGAILRTAHAASTDAVIAVESKVDPHNPNVVRASTGALFSVPLAVSDWQEVAPWLTSRGIAIVNSSPEAAQSLWDTDLSGPVALVVGSEDQGLSSPAEELADAKVLIPQVTNSAVDSLNVSVAAAILLFEARRQRI